MMSSIHQLYKDLKRVIFLWLFISPVFAQQSIQLIGRVVDAQTREGMSDVNILVKGSFIGTTTNNDGDFILTFRHSTDLVLEFSRIGYRPQVFTVSGNNWQDPIKIEMVEQALFIPRVVVSASRREQDILESPVSITVLSLRSIEDRSIIDLEEALSSEVGVSIVNGQLNIRGSSGFAFGTGNRSLVLIDNVPILGSAAGNMTWNMVPTSEIERVEIVRSGGSTLYGSSAMGGVINIITRMPSGKPESELMVQSGFYSKPSFEQWEWRNKPGLFRTIHASHSRQIGSHGGWLRIQERNNDGHTELGWERSINATGKLKLNFNQNFSGSVFINHFRDETGLASQWKSPADPYEAPDIDIGNSVSGSKTNVNSFFNLALSANQIIKLKGSFLGSSWENTTVLKDFSDENRFFGEFQHTGTWSDKFQTTTGISTNYSTIDARIFGKHDTRSLSGYVLMQNHLPQKITLLAGLRGETYWVDDEVQDFTWAPQMSINKKLNDGLSLRASLSRGFRVPSVAELFASTQLNVFKVEPNPELKAETSNSAEVGISLAYGELGFINFASFDLALFTSKYDQMIEPTPDRYGIIHFENITDARISGLEMAGLVSLFENKLMLQSAYSYLDPVEIDKKGNVVDTLSYRFRHTFTNSAKVDLKIASIILENRYSSRIDKVELFDENKMTGEDRRVPIKVWNAGLNWHFASIGFKFRVNNMFQYNYTELERNMAPGRAISLTLTKLF